MKQWARGPRGDEPRGALTVVRELAFVELIELLEFSHLRLDASPQEAGTAWVGTQEWQRRIDGESSAPGAVYVCTTLDALHDAVLAPEHAELKIDMPTQSRVRLRTLSTRQGASQACLRVDLQALIRRVLVPTSAPTHLFELVKHVVMTRLWVEVARV
ncbi:hypothetical protein ELS24_00480 [Achromobacter spanius]|uniref:hypothetical protein n=1 Tax=Achromobacter spanius TaxID=217203 RepID=UPI000F8F87B5|nr:hypothetical protein [Achromobacter spanius]AZS77035.1 hypothetical protein ELS24_00480 [Achromobacter spanius]